MSFCLGRAKIGARVGKILWACLWCFAAAIVGVRAQGKISVDGAVGGFVFDASGTALVGEVVQVETGIPE